MRMIRILTIVGLFLTFSSGSVFAKLDHSHAEWTKILKKYVEDKGASSTFDYARLKKDGTQDLDAYLAKLSAVSQSEFDKFSEKEQLAFYFNAYNAFTVKLIMDNYPLKSIKDIGGLFSSPWKIKFFTLLGKKRHLDWIEHEQVREKYNEPRVHFAVNCASIGCPKLGAEAFVATKLDRQLEDGAIAFLNDNTRNYFDEKKNELYLSKIFSWFSEDFEKNGNNLRKFATKYMMLSDAQVKLILDDDKVDIEYTDYDWKLNSPKKKTGSRLTQETKKNNAS